MKIEQKRFSTKTSFNFEDDGITYEIRDGSGGTTFRTDYEDIAFETSFFEERNVWLRNAGYCWVALGVIGMVLRFVDSGRAVPPIWLYIGIGCVAAYYWRRSTYTVFDAPKGRIHVIRDQKHDAIVDELVKRRRACYRSRYAVVDPTNSPELEERRFAWLHEHDIISDEEHAGALKQISAGLADHDEM